MQQGYSQTREMPAKKRANQTAILAERLRRQRFSSPLRKPADYPKLARLLQPLSTGAYARPGSPPSLPGRTRFNDEAAADRLRGSRELVKGRFLGGGIGYVLAEDLEVYANAFCKPLEKLGDAQRRVLSALQATGPLNPGQLKEETELLNKQIMPALHRLQTAFLVFEDQFDDDWERAWAEFAPEWPDIEIRPERRDAALSEVLLRFLHAHVFATLEQIKDWSRLPARLIQRFAGELESQGRVARHKVEGLGEGLCLPDDVSLAEREVPDGVFVLHKGDFLVRAHASELARRFGKTDVLQYLLIDGELRGAIRGHWGFNPYDVEDIALDLPAARRAHHREQILKLVTRAYPQPRHAVLRYAGKKL